MRYRIVDDKKLCIPHSGDYIRWRGEDNVEILGEFDGRDHECEACLDDLEKELTGER